MLLALADLIERRLGNINMAMLYQWLHIAVEEGQEQGSDMGTIHIRICHNDNLIVAELGQVKFVADATAKGGNHGTDFCIGIDAIQPSLLYVEYLAPDRQDGLEPSVTALLGRTAGRITLYNEDFAVLRILYRAVSQLAWQSCIEL